MSVKWSLTADIQNVSLNFYNMIYWPLTLRFYKNQFTTQRSGLLLEGLLDLRDARVLLHHQEIGFSVLVEFSDATEQEAGARVLVTNNSDQFPAAGHRPEVTI